MKKLTFVFLCAVSSLLADTTVGLGYRQNDITFGKLSSDQGAYVASVEAKFGSFRLLTAVQNNLTLNSSSLYQADIVAGYTFNSTLVDIELGGNYVLQGKPDQLDFGGHWRPFVSLGKSWFQVTGTLDLESQTSNIEAVLRDSRPLFWGLKAVTAVQVGYTDANDVFPKSLKEIKYTNAYYGGSFDLQLKFVTAGVYFLKNDFSSSWITGWRAGVSQKF